MAVLTRDLVNGEEKIHRKDFSTTYPDLVAGREWARAILTTRGIDPGVPERFHYTIESTSCYHFPVVLAWGGAPSIVNPNLLKAGRRKTDDIDPVTSEESGLDCQVSRQGSHVWSLPSFDGHTRLLPVAALYLATLSNHWAVLAVHLTVLAFVGACMAALYCRLQKGLEPNRGGGRGWWLWLFVGLLVELLYVFGVLQFSANA